jgi:hypothetical protein
MTERPIRVATRMANAFVAALLVAGCVAGPGASRAPVAVRTFPALPSPTRGTDGETVGGDRIANPALKAALLERFGDLAYCDPDLYPVARADRLTAARDHLAAMRADGDAWSAIARRLGFDPAGTLDDATLEAAYAEWKMLRAIDLTPAPAGSAFDAVFSRPNGDLVHVTGTIAQDAAISVAREEPGRRPVCPL